jgi:hypothetical protein
MEMSEEKIAERIDANLMNVSIDEIGNLSRSSFENRLKKIRERSEGRLIIKEYPTASAHSGHFRALLNELWLKKEFKPDVIFIDYLNICSSARYKLSGSVNTYVYIKGIAEELRGLAVEFDVPIWSATQLTRTGTQSSDVEMTDTSECIFVDEQIQLRTGEMKRIGDVVFGDQILANDSYKTVIKAHHPKLKDCVKITLASGKSIIVSRDHVFPTSRGRISVNDGNLSVGDLLNTQ